MKIWGLISEVFDVKSAKAVLYNLGTCPNCGGAGWTSSAGSPPEQIGCDVCRSYTDTFWLDGLEYYTCRMHLSDDITNVLRNNQGQPVDYGYFKRHQYVCIGRS
jgi:hypothetical protein